MSMENIRTPLCVKRFSSEIIFFFRKRLFFWQKGPFHIFRNNASKTPGCHFVIKKWNFFWQKAAKASYTTYYFLFLMSVKVFLKASAFILHSIHRGHDMKYKDRGVWCIITMPQICRSLERLLKRSWMHHSFAGVYIKFTQGILSFFCRTYTQFK